MFYTVIVREVLEREVKVKANDIEEAFDKVEEQYDDEDIVLDAEDHISTDLIWNNKERNIRGDYRI